MSTSAASPACPKCGATVIQIVPVRRASVPEALAAEYFRGMPGGAETLQQSVCARCGCRWLPRTTEEHHLRALSGQLGPEAMRAAEADAAAGLARRRRRSAMPEIPARTWAIAIVMVIVILLALLT